MEQQNFSSPNQVSPKGIKPFWLVILLVVVLALVGVLLWQKNNASQITNSLQQQIISLQNKVTSQGQAGQNYCVPEGQYFPGTMDPPCCFGLKKIYHESAYFNDNNGDECHLMPTPRDLVCAACGNGVCGIGENKCNCPADCK